MNKEHMIKRLHENIEYLIKIQGCYIGDVETSIGVSKGYLSRSKGVDLPVSKVIALAEYFVIPVSKLLYENYKEYYLTYKIAQMQSELAEIESEVKHEK